MSRSIFRVPLISLLLAASVLLACKFPASITYSLARPGLASTPTPSVTPTPLAGTIAPELTPSPGLETAYPAPKTAYPGPAPDTPYPGFPGLPPYPGVEQVTPYPGFLPASTASATSAPSSTASPAQATGPGFAAGSTTYPPPETGIYPPPAGNLPYPGPPAPYPGPSLPAATAVSQALTPTFTLQAVTPVPLLTQALTPTSTPSLLSPTPTRFLTPVPTLTPTPTRTPTPLPPPPWVSAQLYASDPSTVRLASGEVQLVEFFAFWSGPSQAMAPTVQSLEDEYREQVLFTYLDIDDPATDTFQSQLGFRVEPHFFLLDPQGHILHQWIGYVTADQFRQAFQSALNP